MSKKRANINEKIFHQNSLNFSLSRRDAGMVTALPSVPHNQTDDTYLDERLSNEGAKKATRSFISGFTRGGIAIYKEHLLHNAREGLFFLEIDLEDLKNDKEALHDSVLKEPNEYIPLVSSPKHVDPRREGKKTNE